MVRRDFGLVGKQTEHVACDAATENRDPAQAASLALKLTLLVLVDSLHTRDLEHDVERSVRIRWNGGELRLWFRTPASAVSPADDWSPFLAATLLAAMRRQEDLELEGPVSPRLLRRAELIQSAYEAWDPRAKRARVRVAGEARAHARAAGIACFFSRGVDSTFSATVDRAEPGPLTHLVFCDRFLPMQRREVRDEEARRTRAAAELIGLPLLVVGTNFRELTDMFISWEDAHGPALASIALLLAGRIGHVIVPSWADYAGLGACGTSPLLDPLWSTESVELEHDSTALGRTAKLAWLTRERPEVLRDLKVCLRENRANNCGRCRKCLWTMACLRAAGAQDLVESFEEELDLERVRSLRPYDLQALLYWAQLSRELDRNGDDGELRRAILHALRRSARPSMVERIRRLTRRPRVRSPDPFLGPFPPAFSDYETKAALSLLKEGRPYP
jgi:hypothetical protein